MDCWRCPVAIPTATAGAIVLTWVTGASSEKYMVDAPVLETPEVAAWGAQWLDIMRACLAATLLPWALPYGRKYFSGEVLQLGVTILPLNKAVLFLTLAAPPRHNLLFYPESRFISF